MNGPYILDKQTIDKVITVTSAGTYILSKNGENAHYVGRSDSDINGRLKWWVDNSRKYSHFWFEYASSPKSAFEVECKWWHEYKPSDNQMHPDRPTNTNWQCPVCNIF